jgi:hypothetical protein
VKYCFLILFSAAAIWAQATVVAYKTDLNGHRVPVEQRKISPTGDVTDLRQSINGRSVPMEKTETKILSETATGRTVEVVVRKYDQTGNLASTERTVTEEQNRGDAGATLRATIYRSDLNGRLLEAERRVIETQKQGAVTSSDVAISRIGIDGTLETMEKRKVVTTAAADKTDQVETVYLVNNRQFYEAARNLREERVENGKTIATTTNYQADYSGKMTAFRQEVASTVKAADGSETIVLDILAPAVEGLVREPGRPLAVKEQQVITRLKASDGTVTEVTAMRRPLLSDPNRLGEPRVTSETVCTGNCTSAATK